MARIGLEVVPCHIHDEAPRRSHHPVPIATKIFLVGSTVSHVPENDRGTTNDSPPANSRRPPS
jgi:hypothetical protein